MNGEESSVSSTGNRRHGRTDGTFQPARSIVTLKKKKRERERNIIISTCWTPGSQFGQVSVAQNSPLWEMGSSAFMPSLMNYLWD